MGMVDRYFEMTYSLGQSSSVAKKEVARRLAGFPLIVVTICELAIDIFKSPVEGIVKLSIMGGKRLFAANPKETWEKYWHPLETLLKVALLFVGFLSTILFSWTYPTLNHQIHEKLGIIPTHGSASSKTAQAAAIASATSTDDAKKIKELNEKLNKLNDENEALEKAKTKAEQANEALKKEVKAAKAASKSTAATANSANADAALSAAEAEAASAMGVAPDE